VILPYTQNVLESGTAVAAEADGSYALGSGDHVFTATIQ
jgi:hypothetical protein